MNALREAFDRLRPFVRARRNVRGPMRPSWGEDLEAFALVLHWGAKVSPWLPLAWQRVATDPERPDTPLVRSTVRTPVRAGGVPAVWFRRPTSDPTRVLLYLHGGGYSVGSPRSHRDLIAGLAEASGATALALDYRLAPEHRFPAQLEDALAAYRWLAREVSPERIVIGGESAGGGLTLSTLIALRDRGEPLPAAAFVLSPWVDLEGGAPSFGTNARFDFVNHRTMQRWARRFVAPRDLRHPLAAPLYADLHGLPPLLIHAGGAETLLDDARRLASRAAAANVDVELEVWGDMIHAWHIFAGMVPEAQEGIDAIGAFVRAHVGTPSQAHATSEASAAG